MKFSRWRHWADRDVYEGIKFPGIYAIAISSKKLDGKAFTYKDPIVYIGMTNSQKGLQGRLKQFDDTISNRVINHGGAHRVVFKHPDYARLVKKLYVSTIHWECDVVRLSPRDLELMGEVTKAEYVAMANVRTYSKSKRLPEFNDKKRSPKY